MGARGKRNQIIHRDTQIISNTAGMKLIANSILFCAIYDTLYPYPNSSASMVSTGLNLSIGDINTAKEDIYDLALTILIELDAITTARQ